MTKRTLNAAIDSFLAKEDEYDRKHNLGDYANVTETTTKQEQTKANTQQ